MSQAVGRFAPKGDVKLHVVRAFPAKELTLSEIRDFGQPRKGLSDEVNEWRRQNQKHLWRGFRNVLAARKMKLPHFYGQVWMKLLRENGEIVPLGLASARVVTTVGVNAIVDAFQNLFELEEFKYHGIGTGSNAEAVGDTALQTELTTQYQTNSTRATGSLTEGAANIFRTVGTNTVDAAVTITEHGIFSDVDTGQGTLLDRSVFAGVALGIGDSLQTTYDLTVSAGG